MPQKVVEVDLRAILPTGGGCAIFVGNAHKVFSIHIDGAVGNAVAIYLRGAEPPRPLTHDLIASILLGFGARLERVIINEVRHGIFHARLIITSEGEAEERKILELDARSSDAIALAIRLKVPIHVTEEVWGAVEDMSELLSKMEESATEEEKDEL